MGNEMEEYRDIIGWEGLYRINREGIILNNRNQKIGNYYYCSFYSGSTAEKQHHSIKKLLIENFGLVNRKKNINLKKKNKIIKIEEKLKWTSREEYVEYTNQIWLQHSGDTPNYLNYFKCNDITIDQILHSINTHIECKDCCKVLQYENLTIEWLGKNGKKEITEGFLSFYILRYIMKGMSIKRVRITQLYAVEVAQWRRIKNIIFGDQPYYRDVIEDDDDDDEIHEDEVIQLRYHKGKNKLADHSLTNKFFEKNNIVDNEYEFTNVNLNYNNFTFEDTMDSRFYKIVYNCIPIEIHNCKHQSTINTKLQNEIIGYIYKKYGKLHTLCEIVVYFAAIQQFEIFNVFKKLNPEFQKIIIKEIGK